MEVVSTAGTFNAIARNTANEFFKDYVRRSDRGALKGNAAIEYNDKR